MIYPPAAAVYKILAEEAGAYDDDDSLRSFEYHWPECGEYRFQGNLGFGGKVWANRGSVYVTCYPEDSNRDRETIIRACNTRLEALSVGS